MIRIASERATEKCISKSSISPSNNQSLRNSVTRSDGSHHTSIYLSLNNLESQASIHNSSSLPLPLRPLKKCKKKKRQKSKSTHTQPPPQSPHNHQRVIQSRHPMDPAALPDCSAEDWFLDMLRVTRSNRELPARVGDHHGIRTGRTGS